MRYCKYLSSENGASLSRYALVEKRNGVLWATLPMQAPQEDLSARILGGLPVPTLAVNFEPVPLSDLNLLPPVTPSKILCVGRNYRDHAAELGNEVPKEPLLFLKPPSALLAPKGVVRLPAISTRVDYEGELGIVIARRCHKRQGLRHLLPRRPHRLGRDRPRRRPARHGHHAAQRSSKTAGLHPRPDLSHRRIAPLHHCHHDA